MVFSRNSILDPLQSDSSGVSWLLQLLIQVCTDRVLSVQKFQTKGQTGDLSLYCYFHKETKVTYYMFIQQGLFLVPNSLYHYMLIFPIMWFSVIHIETFRICQNPSLPALQYYISHSCAPHFHPPSLLKLLYKKDLEVLRFTFAFLSKSRREGWLIGSFLVMPLN